MHIKFEGDGVVVSNLLHCMKILKVAASVTVLYFGSGWKLVIFVAFTHIMYISNLYVIGPGISKLLYQRKSKMAVWSGPKWTGPTWTEGIWMLPLNLIVKGLQLSSVKSIEKYNKHGAHDNHWDRTAETRKCYT